MSTAIRKLGVKGRSGARHRRGLTLTLILTLILILTLTLTLTLTVWHTMWGGVRCDDRCHGIMILTLTQGMALTLTCATVPLSKSRCSEDTCCGIG